jgi:hypothetical protein
MRQHVLFRLLAACVLAGCGGAVEDLAGGEEALASGVNTDPVPVQYRPTVIAPTYGGLSAPLRELPVSPAQPSVARPRLRRPPRQPLHPPLEDPVIQRHPGSWKAPELLLDLKGMGDGFAGPNGPFVFDLPPGDPSGDVGPHHYVQIVNTSVSVFDKGGRVLNGPVLTRTLWTGFGGPCTFENDGDGVVRYDLLADRWVITQLAEQSDLGRFFQCVAVSETGDPTGSYYRYAFQFEALNDYPKLGLWPDAYYMTFNMDPEGSANARVCALDRARLLAGDATATMQCFVTPSWGLLPADLDGPMPPPPGSPNFVFGLGEDSTLEMWKFHVDWDDPASSSLTGPLSIPVKPFVPLLCEDFGCVPQPGGAPLLDPLGDVLMNRAPYRNFGDHQAVLLTHAVWADEDRGGMRWYELRDLESPVVRQQGTWAPDSHYRWMGSIASDGMGNIALGYSISSRKLYPSLRYTVRRFFDPPGKMGREETLARGRASFSDFRWGDYSSMNVDPVDGCTFWYTAMYMDELAAPELAREEEEEEVNEHDAWSTRIGSFRLPGCDLLAPIVTLLSPSSGATVRGEVEVLVMAKDDVGVTRVELYVDGRRVDTDKHEPYRFEWDSTEVPDGSHELLVKAYDEAGNVGQASATVVVANDECGATEQLLANPGFEDGRTGWQATAGVISNITSPALPAHAGAWRAWLGGYGRSHRDTLAQEITIPEGACTAELTFWLRIYTTETAPRERDTLKVRLLDSRGRGVATLARYSNLDAGPDYVPRRFDLRPFRGRTLRIVFESEENSSRATGFLIDDAALDVRVRSTPVSLGEKSGASSPP